MRTYQAMWAIHTLFCLLVLLLFFKTTKKAKPVLCIILSAILSTSIVTFGYVNMYTIHKTTYNLTTTKKITPTKICFISDVHYPNANNPQRLKEITNTLLKVKPNFYLLGGDFVDESTSKEDMEILFKQLGRLTKVAPVYFVYGNHENKTKFTRTKLNQVITKNNITILNDQEVHLNNIILIGRKDYTNKNRKKTKDYNLTNKTYNIVLDHQPQGTRENIKNNVDLNSAVTPTTVKCFHSLIHTIYNLTLRAITAKKHSSTAQKSLAPALLVEVFLLEQRVYVSMW